MTAVAAGPGKQQVCVPSVEHVAQRLRVDGTHLVTADRNVGGIEDQTEQELSDRIYRAAHAGNTDDTKTLDGVLQDYEFERFVRGRVVDGLTDVAVDSISTGALSIGRVSVSASPTEEALFEVDGTTYLRTTSWRPNLSPGFLLYDHRLASHRATSDDAPIERIYIAQSDPETAVSEWAVCIERLIELGIPFRTKLLSRRVRYPRSDALVVYAQQRGSEILEAVLDVRRQRTTNEFEKSTSLFVADHGHGVGTAQEPLRGHQRGVKESFGQHRSTVVARAFARHRSEGISLTTALEQSASVSGVDLADFSRNSQA